MKRIFVIDWVLVALFVASAATGVMLHAAHHGICSIPNLGLIHIVCSGLFLAGIAMHIQSHRAWFSGIARTGLKNKRFTPIALTLLFTFIAATGIIMMFTHGLGLGLWHYKAGLGAIAFAVIHIIRRFHILSKSLK